MATVPLPPPPPPRVFLASTLRISPSLRRSRLAAARALGTILELRQRTWSWPRSGWLTRYPGRLASSPALPGGEPQTAPRLLSQQYQRGFASGQQFTQLMVGEIELQPAAAGALPRMDGP